MGRVVGLTGAKRRVLNLGSYNYLGFAAHDEYCTGRVLDTLRQQGWSTCSSRSEAGRLRPQRALICGCHVQCSACLCCTHCTHMGLKTASERAADANARQAMHMLPGRA